MRIVKHVKIFCEEIWYLIKSPFFIILTFFGNSFIGITGLLFYFIEEGRNPRVTRYMDAIWWSFATATTTGYGDITPVTDAGKILSIILMLIGLALFSMYTALFAETILTSKKLFPDK
ncbi:MAG: potassium channel family protein [Bacteriovoracaceae bacterium]